MQSTWNLLERSAGAALREAHESGVLVQVKETLANGRLAVDPPAQLVDVARRYGVGCDAVAVAAVYAQPWADVVLIGPASVDQLRSNLAGAAVSLTLTLCRSRFRDSRRSTGRTVGIGRQ